ncbi:MAG: ABC transporter transmembrane domain-containing protein [Puia sp.]
MPGTILQENTQVSEKQHSFISLMIWAVGLSRPYRKWVCIILVAMLIEAIMSVATPWPLKIIIDDVVARGVLPKWLRWTDFLNHSNSKYVMSAIVAFGFVLINALGSLAGYINNYYNESVAQHVANDLRRRIYHHLQHLSLSYYDTHQTENC